MGVGMLNGVMAVRVSQCDSQTGCRRMEQRAAHVIGEQRTFTNGRIIATGGRVRRGKQQRADYLLYYRRDYPLAVVEAKELGLPAETGVQQAKEYAEILGLKFAYATNGHRIIEILGAHDSASASAFQVQYHRTTQGSLRKCSSRNVGHLAKPLQAGRFLNLRREDFHLLAPLQQALK